MKTKISLLSLMTIIFMSSCSKNVNYSPEHIKQTTGRYLFNQEEVIEVLYENNDLYIKWKAGKMKPVVLDENTFFVPDMYKKLRFVIQPQTKKRYLGVVSEEDENKVEYAYLKVADTFKTPRMYWRDKEYKKASDGYIALHKQDSTLRMIGENEVNDTGYKLLRDKKFDEAIAVLEMNVALYPESDNTYDSLAAAFLKSGDSIQAYFNYKRALKLNSGNQTAKDYVKNFPENKLIPDL